MPDPYTIIYFYFFLHYRFLMSNNIGEAFRGDIEREFLEVHYRGFLKIALPRFEMRY